MSRFNPHFGRRALLSRLGVSAAVAPFLPLLNASGAEAPPKRLVLFFTPHGTIWDNWVPTGTDSAFTLSRILKPLERHQKKIAVLAGLQIKADGVGAPHTKGPSLLWSASPLLEDQTFIRADGSGGRFFGWNSSASIDQVIAQKIGLTTPWKSLEFGVRSGGSNPASRMIYAAPKQPLAPEANPYAMFDRLFGARSSTVLKQRKASVDVLKQELDALKTRAPAADQPRIQAHIDGIANIEKRLLATPKVCAAPTMGMNVDAFNEANTPTVIDRQMELMAAALACDLTRVASLQYTVGDNDNGTYSWLGITRMGHHLLTHAGDSDAQAKEDLTNIYAWYAGRFAYLLDQLDAVKEGTGTMLDNTLVIWGSELGKGNTHSFQKTPFVVAGGAAGAMRMGRFMQFDNVIHNRLLVAALNAFGIAADTFGKTDTGKGPLPGLLA
ncbi:MAG: DUF1552 domain-containing protein [Deltaproteobacteria bacterium]|nr:DUF1552 domain-containing protein [Deltaproteobacteria bacterium]